MENKKKELQIQLKSVKSEKKRLEKVKKGDLY